MGALAEFNAVAESGEKMDDFLLLGEMPPSKLHGPGRLMGDGIDVLRKEFLSAPFSFMDAMASGDRGSFVPEVLQMGVAEHSTADGQQKRRHDDTPAGFHKFYRVHLDEPTTLAAMEARAEDDPDGPVARFLELRRLVQTTLGLPPDGGADFLRFDPPGLGADTAHADDKTDTNRWRCIMKCGSGDGMRSCLRFRTMNAHEGGGLSADGLEATAVFETSGRGVTYAGGPVAMGAVGAGPDGGPPYFHHTPSNLLP